VTAGKPALGLLLSVIAGIANIIFDYIFMVILHMGIKGAALGTGIGYMIPALMGTIFFLLVLPGFLQAAGVWLAIPVAELLTFMLTIYLIFKHRNIPA